MVQTTLASAVGDPKPSREDIHQLYKDFLALKLPPLGAAVLTTVVVSLERIDGMGIEALKKTAVETYQGFKKKEQSEIAVFLAAMNLIPRIDGSDVQAAAKWCSSRKGFGSRGKGRLLAANAILAQLDGQRSKKGTTAAAMAATAQAAVEAAEAARRAAMNAAISAANAITIMNMTLTTTTMTSM